MRYIVFLLLINLFLQPAFSQTPSKQEMQKQIGETIKVLNDQIADLEKQIAEAKKNKEDEETIKDLEDQVSSLKKQLAMIGGVNRNLSKMSDKLVQQANEEETTVVPKKDVTRINSLPKKILSEAELLLFIKNVHAGIEKIIPAIERTEALQLYNETRAQYRATAIVANAASGCWMLGHWEKALFIMGKACIDDITNADNLNNYAVFLINTGGEQAALPILEYLNFKYPHNSTIQNNIGQAWFGLGEIDNAKKYLDSATMLYPNHSMANSTLSKIYLAQRDSSKAISFLKASIKENYDPDKEAELANLGYNITYADMPEFNYPMKADPFGIIPIVQSLPEDYPSKIGDDEKVYAINRYVNGLSNLSGKMNEEDEVLNQKLHDRAIRLSTDSQYRVEFLDPHNSPAYKLAARSVELIRAEKVRISSPLITQLLLTTQWYFADVDKVKTGVEIYDECLMIWEDSVRKPIADLARAMKASQRGMDCFDVDAAINAYMSKEAEIKKEELN